MEEIKASEYVKQKDDMLIDIRAKDDFMSGAIEGAVHFDLVNPDLEQLDKNKRIVICCYHGNSSFVAGHQLSAAGFNCASLKGGYAEYSKNKK